MSRLRNDPLKMNCGNSLAIAARAPFYPSIAFVSNLILHNLRHFSGSFLLAGKGARGGANKVVKVFFRPDGCKIGIVYPENKKSSQMNQPNYLKSLVRPG